MSKQIDELRDLLTQAEKDRKGKGGLVIAKDGDTPVGFALTKKIFETLEYMDKQIEAMKKEPAGEVPKQRRGSGIPPAGQK